jgi:hypothetical protein
MGCFGYSYKKSLRLREEKGGLMRFFVISLIYFLVRLSFEVFPVPLFQSPFTFVDTFALVVGLYGIAGLLNRALLDI